MTQIDGPTNAFAEEAAVTGAAGQAGPALGTAAAHVRDNVAVVATKGADGGQLMLDSLKAGSDAFTAAMEASFGKASKGLTDLSIKAVDVLREDLNATFELWKQVIGVRTLQQLLDLQADHARRRVERLGEQAETLSSLAQKTAYDSLEPLRTGFGKAAA